MMTGKDALIALANGEEVEYKTDHGGFAPIEELFINDIIGDSYCFRIKPRTITINGIEVPAPFEPKDGGDFHVYYLHGLYECGYDWMHSGYYKKPHLVWKSKEEIKQVVAALRSIFK